MKIVHIEQDFHPEYGYQVQNFCRFHSRDHDVHVVTGDRFPAGPIQADSATLANLDLRFERETGCSIHRLPVRYRWRHKAWLGELSRCLNGLKPDVIFAHAVEYLSLPRLLMKGWHRRALVVTDSHDLPSASHHRLLRWLYKISVRDIYVRVINRRRIVCFYTAPPTRRLLQDYGIDQDLLHYLPLGIDFTRFSFDSAARAALRQEWGIAENDACVVLYTGKHDSEKQPHLLYQALQKLPGQRKRGLVLVSVGARNEKYYASYCNQVLLDLRASGVRVFEEPPVPAGQLRSFYSAADLAVFPAQSTLSCLDAMACRLPVIMQDDETNSDRLRFGGDLFPAGDVEALTESILKLLDDKSRRELLGVAGEMDMRARFDYSKIVGELEKRLEEALRKR